MEADSQIAALVRKLDIGESFYFPIAWHGSSPERPGHAMVMEVEAEPDGQLLLRIFNLGSGVQYHTMKKIRFDYMAIPFHEIVNVNRSRLLGGAVTTFASFVMQNPPTIGLEWDAASMYEVLLSSLGGRISARQVNSSAFRPLQYIGNCAFQSAILILDKYMLSDALAERMRFFVLARGTFQYLKDFRAELEMKDCDKGSGQAPEARRRLLLKGIQATLEQVECQSITLLKLSITVSLIVRFATAIACVQAERALEVGGFVGVELDETVKTLRKHKKMLTVFQNQDIGAAPALSAGSFSPSKLSGLNFESEAECMQLKASESEVHPKLGKPKLGNSTTQLAEAIERYTSGNVEGNQLVHCLKILLREDLPRKKRIKTKDVDRGRDAIIEMVAKLSVDEVCEHRI